MKKTTVHITIDQDGDTNTNANTVETNMHENGTNMINLIAIQSNTTTPRPMLDTNKFNQTNVNSTSGEQGGFDFGIDVIDSYGYGSGDDIDIAAVNIAMEGELETGVESQQLQSKDNLVSGTLDILSNMPGHGEVEAEVEVKDGQLSQAETGDGIAAPNTIETGGGNGVNGGNEMETKK